MIEVYEKTYLCGFDCNFLINGESQGKFLGVTFNSDKEINSDTIMPFLEEIKTHDSDIVDCFLVCDKDLNIIYKNESLQNEDLIRAFGWMEENKQIKFSSRD